MTSQNSEPVIDQKVSDKELNFRALEAKYERQLQQEREARLEAERMAQDKLKHDDSEDDDNEPYVDRKKLNKTLNKYTQNNQSEIKKAMEHAKLSAKEELRQEMWLEQHQDFESTMQLAQKFADASPRLADSILRMPEGFERQKLVYENIKALGLDKPKTTEPSIQQKVDANRKGPYYQPANVGTAPYASQGDFSQSGQKQAYEKMQELKNRLRIG